MKIRIKFAKEGAMKFIGHLDIMRYFQKVMRRAHVDIRYSEGFSPHQIMSFASPLGVGITSNGEYLDIEVHSTDSSKVMVDRLNQAMVEEIRVLSYRRLEDSGKNAMSLVSAADYTLEFRENHVPEDLEGFFENLDRFYGQEQILIVKPTKRGQKEIDLKPLVYRLERRGMGIFMQVSAGSSDNIKPELVMEEFYKSRQWEYPRFAFQIQREEVYGRDGGTGRLIPLEDFGEDIE